MAAKNLLDRAKQVASTAPAKAKEKGMRELVVPEFLQDQFTEFVELGYISKSMEDVTKSHRQEMADAFLDIWATEMWETRRRPENFKAVVRRGNATIDCSCNFVVEVRKDSIQRKIPAQDQIPEGKTLEETLVSMLVKIGISEVNANRFVQEEVLIQQVVDFKETLDIMYGYADGTPQKNAVEKLLTYMQLRNKSGLAKLPMFTDEEEAVCLVVKQKVAFKEGLADRLFTYCNSKKELLSLLTEFVNPTLKLYLFSVADGDERSVVEDRLAKTTIRFLFASA